MEKREFEIMGKIPLQDNNTRLYCVDPNDLHGQIDNQPMTPDYTDYCIWCNLVVETVSRLKNQAGGTDSSGSYSIQYNMTNAGKHEYVSFLQGKDSERYNYLTTDYTDIDFKSVKSRNIIEGLQIESIRVSLQNFQCPMVTIKFVDIRGGGFFGREEATHNEYGQLSGLETNPDGTVRDNIFGCFMTMPYPRFKLQIKGFYGKPVTYQLTCCSFQGSFNSSTGNFDITTQFVGYEYGVLGDIPFSYIVAAPYTRRGSRYWDEHVNTAAWSLATETNAETDSEVAVSEPPIKLVDFYNKIEAAINEYSDNEEDINDVIQDGTYDEVLRSYSNRLNSLENIQNLISKLKADVTNYFKNENVVNAVSVDTDIMVIFSSKGEKIDIPKDILTLRNTICESIDKYIREFGQFEDSIDGTMAPNCDENGNWAEWVSNQVDFSKYIEYSPQGDSTLSSKSDSSPNVIIAEASANGSITRIENENSCDGSKIRMLGTDNYLFVNSFLSKKIFEALKTNNWSMHGTNGYKNYAAAIDFGNSTQKIAETVTNLKIDMQHFIDNEKNYKSIKDMLGFAPYIENYFKVVMCHLETFINLFYKTADAIEENQKERTPQKLGIRNLRNQSDVPGDKYKYVPPFPAVYKNYETEEEFNKVINTGGNILETSWIGDFKGETKWAEEEFVNEMAEALRMVWDTVETTAKGRADAGNVATKEFKPSYNPIDYISSFPSYAVQSKESMAFYTAMRAATMFGVVDTTDHDEQNDSTCKLLGIADAYNYAAECSDGDFLATLQGSGEGETLSKEIMDIVMCNDNNNPEEKHEFEISDVKNGRHPVFSEDGDYLDYVYMKTAKGGIMIPQAEYTELSSEQISQTYKWNNGCFQIRNADDESFTFGDSGEDFINEIKSYTGTDNETIEHDYTNKCMFEIITDQEKVQDITKNADKFTNITDVAMYKGELFKKLDSQYLLGKDNLEKYRSSTDMKNYNGKYSDMGLNNGMICKDIIPNNLRKYSDEKSTKEFINNFINTVKF